MSESDNQPTNQSNFLVRKKERKKELLNPTGPHRGLGVALKNLAVPIPQIPEWLDIIKNLRQLAIQDGSSNAHVYREALIEYHDKHFPGNPGLPLEHWTKDLAFSEAAKEKIAPPPEPKSTPNYVEMSTENLAALYAHPWKLEGFDRQLVGHILKSRGVDREKIKKKA